MQSLSPYKFYSVLSVCANAKRENGFYHSDQKQATWMKWYDGWNWLPNIPEGAGGIDETDCQELTVTDWKMDVVLGAYYSTPPLPPTFVYAEFLKIKG